MAAFAAMAAPTTLMIAPAPTKNAASPFFTVAGIARTNSRKPLSASITVARIGLNTCANGSPSTIASVSSDPRRSRF